MLAIYYRANTETSYCCGAINQLYGIKALRRTKSLSTIPSFRSCFPVHTTLNAIHFVLANFKSRPAPWNIIILFFFFINIKMCWIDHVRWSFLPQTTQFKPTFYVSITEYKPAITSIVSRTQLAEKYVVICSISICKPQSLILKFVLQGTTPQ